MLFKKIEDPRSIRRALGINQQDFWAAVGVTQSGGSRYENGRNMPRPVRELVRLVHVEQVDLAAVTHEALAVVAHMQAVHPQLYAGIVERVRADAIESRRETRAAA